MSAALPGTFPRASGRFLNPVAMPEYSKHKERACARARLLTAPTQLSQARPQGPAPVFLLGNTPSEVLLFRLVTGPASGPHLLTILPRCSMAIRQNSVWPLLTFLAPSHVTCPYLSCIPATPNSYSSLERHCCFLFHSLTSSSSPYRPGRGSSVSTLETVCWLLSALTHLHMLLLAPTSRHCNYVFAVSHMRPGPHAPSQGLTHSTGSEHKWAGCQFRARLL